ncbi:DUF190 domain-containing protein [Geomonas sp. RF6]|uniref:DUF190 domain-containing protein n=1 Tax=Geomonas sp. RF6 TaxID=2897342 RepID=UPI001E55517C|nr:DUF190 domain-containing protein [Geomonas sp. RF6]UFS71754.1 DUF190 domain-containing protein [Geomonas sp. RF6]
MGKLEGEKTLMRIHISENDTFHHKPLYEALTQLLMKEGFKGATVLRGISGFGPHLVYHSDRFLELAKELPIIIEVVASQERIDRTMPKIDEMMCGGLITLEKVRVVRYCDKNDEACLVNEP